jgi:hypothetical protein
MSINSYRELIDAKGPDGETFCARCNKWADHDERSPDCPNANQAWGNKDYGNMTEWLLWNRRTAWFDSKLYDKFTIHCPTCDKDFEWQGHFYAPMCPTCKSTFTERKGE